MHLTRLNNRQKSAKNGRSIRFVLSLMRSFSFFRQTYTASNRVRNHQDPRMTSPSIDIQVGDGNLSNETGNAPRTLDGC